MAAVAGCTTKIPPPEPPIFGELIEFDLGEAPLAETAKASQAIAEVIQLPRKATLRIKGSYRAVEADQYLLISVDITRQSKNGTPVIYASGAASATKRDDFTYTFTADIVSEQSAPGEFDLVMRAGKQFIAHGKVVVKD